MDGCFVTYVPFLNVKVLYIDYGDGVTGVLLTFAAVRATASVLLEASIQPHWEKLPGNLFYCEIKYC